MIYKYTLPQALSLKVANMEEFANGATQVTISLKDGRVFNKVLISGSKHIVAIRDYQELPFVLSDIKDIYQIDDDKNPMDRGGWFYWDKW